MFQSIRNYFATPPRRGASPLGAGLSDEGDDPAIPAFQTAWKDGALVEDLFGPHPFALHGSVGASGADNHRPDVAKVETLLGDAGYYKPMTDSGPNGWHNPSLDSAIRSFQKDKGLQVDGLLKPGGPTITAISGLFGGAKPQDKPDSGASNIVEGEWDWEVGQPTGLPTNPGTKRWATEMPTTFPTNTWPPRNQLPPPPFPSPEIGQDAPEPTSRPDSAPLPDRPQGSDERVPVYGQDRAAIMPHVPTQEAIDRYQAEYEKWARENLDKIRMNEDLERRGLPTVYVPLPPRDPRKSPDDIGDILRGGSGGFKPPRRPETQQPQQQPPVGSTGPTITMGGNGKPVIVLGGRSTLPRMPDLFPGHTISEAGAHEHEDWAKLLKRDAKPEETARILNVAITDHGDQGAADAADLLGRFAQHDPQKAETLRSLVSRQAGREVPFRIAPLGEGFREPTQEEKLAQAPKSPFGPVDGADMEAAGSMAKALLKKGDYQDAYAYLKSAPEATPPYMAAVHDFMRQENPGLAMKFAEQGVQNGMAKPVQVAQAETGTKTDAAPASTPPQPPAANPAQGTEAGTPDQPPQGQGAGSPPANAGNKPLPAPKLDPKYGDATTPPDWKKDTFAKQGDAWSKFNTATANLPGATETEKFVYGQIFAGEGGNLEDPNSKASSGVLPSTLEEAKASGKFPGLENVTAPKDMNADQRAQVMQWHVDRSLNRVGGAKMLDDIDDKASAYALADVLYRFGRNGGGTVLRSAINKVGGEGTVEPTGSVNTKTFEAYRQLTANPETRDRVLYRPTHDLTRWPVSSRHCGGGQAARWPRPARGNTPGQ